MTGGKDPVSNQGELVLIVEDEEPIAEVLAEIVSEAGYRPLVAQNGRVGLALARSEHPALIITDLMMPFLDGAELIATLRGDEDAPGAAATPIVVMTAAGRGHAEGLHYDALLAKPFDIQEVERLLRRYVGNVDRDAHSRTTQ